MFKKLFTYFLLLNFLNTVCFPDLPALDYSSAGGFKLSQAGPDEIDSMVEFVAEYCFDLDDDFADTDFDDASEDLKPRNFSKDFLLPFNYSFRVPGFFAPKFPSGFSIRFPASNATIDSPPPKSGLI